jgi:E3 ubiquitin-protein ligase TRIP12
MINDAPLQDLSLDLTLPGYDIELVVSSRLQSRMAHAIDIAGQPGRADILVDHRNVHRYIGRVLDIMLAEGVRIPVTAFREGFSRVFPIWDLQTFSGRESAFPSVLLAERIYKRTPLPQRLPYVYRPLRPYWFQSAPPP